ncbi:hypothetical protein [Umezawaea tangerina]|uniref:Uncharacterized protein n=1 Tax=Umezawaea tangerina TaxID=84725 RepID=A0A2T0SPK0_9PSEU|nr:hypothetical protein [Umezawaea tangerina]PRY35335.1 hypothetical protein CLV43_114253 [Umezawaea tangerina]
MKTYSIQSPMATHTRPATCAEVDCPNYLRGWRIHVEAVGPELAHTARTAGARFREVQVSEGHTYLVFEAGQTCFGASRHRIDIGRPQFFVVRGGDWRGNPRGEMRQHTKPEFWVEDFAEHQQTLADAQNKG